MLKPGASPKYAIVELGNIDFYEVDKSATQKSQLQQSQQLGTPFITWVMDITM